jgi:hypothetical protein
VVHSVRTIKTTYARTFRATDHSYCGSPVGNESLDAHEVAKVLASPVVAVHPDTKIGATFTL